MTTAPHPRSCATCRRSGTAPLDCAMVSSRPLRSMHVLNKRCSAQQDGCPDYAPPRTVAQWRAAILAMPDVTDVSIREDGAFVTVLVAGGDAVEIRAAVSGWVMPGVVPVVHVRHPPARRSELASWVFTIACVFVSVAVLASAFGWR